jgi:very-short-patch-repair endonuclease
MGGAIFQTSSSRLWTLAERQHGVVTRRQLLELGFTKKAIQNRLVTGCLHRVLGGVYAVGRPQLTQHGRWMAAVLACGSEAALASESAGMLWQLLPAVGREIHVAVPSAVRRNRRGIVAIRRTLAVGDVTRHQGIPVTSPVCTLIELASRLERAQLEAAINEADKRDLVDPETLRAALGELRYRPGAKALRETLDRRTFTLTDSELERRFLPIARRAGLPRPETGVYVNGFKVDFHWPELGLVVETDGLRYHRTPAQQGRDRLRDQAHVAAGLTPLRFTHAQVMFEPDHVEATLAAVAGRLDRRAAP